MKKILVTGATGHLGSRAMDLLLKRVDPRSLSVLVRDPARAQYLETRGVKVFKGDYSDYGSLVHAFRGIEMLYFISSNTLTERRLHHENVVGAAREAGVNHIVYTSFQRKSEDGSSPVQFLLDAHLHTEQLIRDSGIAYTILKHGLYAEFIPVYTGDNVLETGTIYLPAGNGRAAFTFRDDLAEGGVAVLTGEGHENKSYEFYAGKTYSFGDIADMLSDNKGKKITYVSPSPEEFRKTMTKAGVPDMVTEMNIGTAEAIRMGEFDRHDDTLRNIIGRECIDITAILDAYKARVELLR